MMNFSETGEVSNIAGGCDCGNERVSVSECPVLRELAHQLLRSDDGQCSVHAMFHMGLLH